MADEFIATWLTWSLMILGGAVGAAIWALRAGLFRNQDRARNLPLWAEMVEDPYQSGKNREEDKSGEVEKGS